MSSETKLPLQKYLKLFSSNGVPMKKAMQISGRLYKTHNTPAQLSALTDLKLGPLGFEKDDRRLIIFALRKAGLFSVKDQSVSESSSESAAVATPPKKRKREGNINELLQTVQDDAATYGNMDFNEVLDVHLLSRKSAIINRAPVMTAWATVVAERQGFKREEALSIASAYTEMNALTKGVSLGIYKDGKQNGIEAVRGGSQPYVELMGRRPLYQAQSDQWRALVNGTPAQPSIAFSYICRSFRQTTGSVIGSMRLLAESFTPAELNQTGWALYTEFRPQVNEWGERAEVRCDSILNLRMKGQAKDSAQVNIEDASQRGEGESQEPPNKIRRIIDAETEKF